MLIDHTGQGNTLLILTDAESRLIRKVLDQLVTERAEANQALGAYNNGVSRGTAKMTEESKAEWKARVKK